MLEVFQNHEKRKTEDGGNSERSHHMTHLSSNPPLLSSVRIGSQIPSRTTNPKLPPLELHHPPTMPMQLASNVMVVPPQQIATSSSHQALLNSFHKRKGFPLAVAHPIVRQNPNYNAAVAHSVPKVLPHKTKMVAHRANTPHSQDSPLDLSAPLDLSIKRKKDPENDDLSSQSILKRQRTLESQNGKGDHIMIPKRNCSEILSKPPPIYPGLRSPHIDHYARQQRKVHPLVHERTPSEMDIINHQYLQLKAKGKDMTTDEKLRFARKAFAIQSAKILERNGSPSHRHGSPPHKEARLPVKRAQMAVPPLVTAGVSSSRPLTQNDQVPAYVSAQQFSEHSRLVNEEKKKQLLARAAAMGIPVDQEPYRPQRSPHLIKENGAVDAEMEEALRKMMMRSTMHQPSPPLSTDQKQHAHRNVAPQQPGLDKRLLEKFAYFEFMKRQMLLRSRQESSQLAARMASSSPSTLPTQSPPLSSARPTSHLEQQEDLKRRLLYEMHLKKNLKQMNSCIHPLPGGFTPQSPPRVGVRIGEGSSKKVPCSSYQYKFSPKDMNHRQSPSLVTQDRPKKDPPKEDLKSCQWLIRNHLDSKPREYQREYQKPSIQNSRQSPETQPQVDTTCTSAGPTASRGPISQGLPHPISLKNLKASTSTKTPHFFTHRVKRDPMEKSSNGAASSSFRNRKNLLNPEKARDHILASMDPALRDLLQGKDQEKQRELFSTLRENHTMHIQRTKGFAINFRDMIAHQISKCIDESSDSSEVIDLTNEISESPSLGEKEKKKIVSHRTSPPHSMIPIVKEEHKNVVVKDNPPPLVKVTDSKAQFVPLTSNSIIQSGSITHKEASIVSQRSHGESVSLDRLPSKPTPEMSVIVENTNLEGVKLEPEEKVTIKREVDIQETKFEKLTATTEFLHKTENKDDFLSSDPGCSNFKSSKIELPDERSEFLVNSSLPKSVSYDPRRRILAALNERLKTALLSSQEPAKEEEVLKKATEDEEIKTFTDTKIIARADQDDRECKIPDQLLEDDDEDGEKTEEEQEVAPKEDETSVAKEEAATAVEVEEEVREEPPKRKRKRRVRRYYRIAPRRTSSRKVTKRRPPQVRRPPAPPSKPKFADFAPEVLQMRTRNSFGRRRQAAMASSYHRDTRYEQEIEKEQQKVMERRRRRTAVLQTTTQHSQDMNEIVNEEVDIPQEQLEPAKSCEENATTVEEKENVPSTNNEDQPDEDDVNTTTQSTEEQERYFFASQYDLKVRIQKKHLVTNFPSQEKKWEALKSSAKVLKEKKCIAEKSLENEDIDTPVLRSLERKRPSTSGLFAMQLNGLPKRRKQTKVRNKLLRARVIPNHHSILRPSVPPPPRELKRLAVNKKLGETLLHKAARLGHDDSALYCISYCTQDINAKDNAGYTPLHECCVNGRLRVAKHMIASGADVNGSAADGTRPVHDAIDNEKVELARLLLAQGGDPLIATYSGRTTRKLARSKETKTLIHGYLKDINGRLLAPQEDLDSLQKLNFNIRFHSSIQTPEDLTNTGIDFMDGAPEPTLEEEEMLFELSDQPMLPTFGLFVKECKRFGNWLQLSDVLQRLDMTRADFLYRHRDVTVYSINRNDMESSVQNSMSQVQGIRGKTTAKSVELVELDDHIRGILGSEEAFVR